MMIASISKRKPKASKKLRLTLQQKTAITCAYCDLKGAYEERFEDHFHDWKEHDKTIETLEELFPFVIE